MRDADVDYFVFKLQGSHLSADIMTVRALDFVDRHFSKVLATFAKKGRSTRVP